MSTLETLRHTLATVEELRSIVHTMKALAAVSIHQYDRAVAALADYDRAVRRGISVLLNELAAEARRQNGALNHEAALRTLEGRVIGALVFGSDHGLCGRFNERLAEYVAQTLRDRSNCHCRILALGSRQVAVLEEQGLPPEQMFNAPGAANAIQHTVRCLLSALEQWRMAGAVEILLFYYRYHGVNSHETVCVRLLPVDLDALCCESPTPTRSLPGYAGNQTEILSALLREWLFVELFRACAESLASENASRLLAMQAAERNITDRLEELKMTYRQQRQEAITAELLDVAAGFEAVGRRKMI